MVNMSPDKAQNDLLPFAGLFPGTSIYKEQKLLLFFFSPFLLKVDRLPWKAFKKLEICFQNKKPSAIVVSI